MCVLTEYSGTVVIDIACAGSSVWYCGHMEESNPFESQMEELKPFESQMEEWNLFESRTASGFRARVCLAFVSLVVYCLRAVFQYVSMVY